MVVAAIVRRPPSIKLNATFVRCHQELLPRSILVTQVAVAAIGLFWFWSPSTAMPTSSGGSTYYRRPTTIFLF